MYNKKTYYKEFAQLYSIFGAIPVFIFCVFVLKTNNPVFLAIQTAFLGLQLYYVYFTLFKE